MSEWGSDRPRKLTIYTLQKSNIVRNPVCFSWTISATNLRQNKKGERTTMANGNYNTIRTSEKYFYNIWMASENLHVCVVE